MIFGWELGTWNLECASMHLLNVGKYHVEPMMYLVTSISHVEFSDSHASYVGYLEVRLIYLCSNIFF